MNFSRVGQRTVTGLGSKSTVHLDGSLCSTGFTELKSAFSIWVSIPYLGSDRIGVWFSQSVTEVSKKPNNPLKYTTGCQG